MGNGQADVTSLICTADFRSAGKSFVQIPLKSAGVSAGGRVPRQALVCESGVSDHRLFGVDFVYKAVVPF